MMNVTKRLSAMLAAMIMVFCTPLFVFAAGQTELRDDAELFTSEEETQLQAELDAFAQKTGWVAVIYTNNEGKTEDNIKPFANRYYADKYGKLRRALYSQLIWKAEQSTSEQKAMQCIISAMAVLILFLMMFSVI
ncbi:TPM domain-containing protein [Ruminococcus bromii]|nr:TPM domain-containing protein [Ruminococcus bromii]